MGYDQWLAKHSRVLGLGDERGLYASTFAESSSCMRLKIMMHAEKSRRQSTISRCFQIVRDRFPILVHDCHTLDDSV